MSYFSARGTKIGLYIILFLPIFFTPFTFFPWHFGKTVIFQVMVEILTALWLIQKLSLRAPTTCRGEAIPSVPRTRRLLRFARNDLNLLDWSIIAFLVILVLTSFLGENLAGSFWGNQARSNGVFVWLYFGAYYFLLKNFLSTNYQLSRRFFVAAVLAAALAGFTALFPFFLPPTWQSISGGGIIGNRAFLAGYLLLALGPTFYLFSVYTKSWRWIFLGVAVFFIYVIWQSANRGVLLGMSFGLFIGLIAAIFVPKSKKYKIIAGASFLALIFLFSALIFLSRQAFVQTKTPRLASLFNLENYTAGTGETRLLVWQMAWDGFKERPILGWGLGNFNIIFDKYFNPKLLAHGFTETVWDKPHNWLLEVTDSAGVLGLTAYSAILFFAFYYLLRKKGSKSEVPYAGRIIFTSTLAAYFVFDLFLFETTNSLILWFLILATISAFCAQRAVYGVGINSSERPATRRSIAKVLLVFMLSLSIYYILFLPSKSSYHMRRAELSNALDDWRAHAEGALQTSDFFGAENAVFLAQQLTQFDKAGAITDVGKIESTALSVAAQLEKAAAENPGNVSFPSWAGQVYMILGGTDSRYYETAEKDLLSAQAISPSKQETLFLLGRLYLLDKKFDKAIEVQKQAVELAPKMAISRWFLGLSYVAAGNLKDGLTEIEKARESGYNFSASQKLYILDLYGLNKDYSKLIAEYKKLIAQEPENVNWYIKLATAYALNGEKKEALETVNKVILLAPSMKKEAEKFIRDYQLNKN